MSEMFSNGTEGDAWMARWCEVCAHEDADTERYCEDCNAIWLSETPACVILEPEGEFHMPPAHICTRFTPGPEGDALAVARAEVVAHVTLHGRRPS